MAAAQQPTTDVERRLIIDRIVGSVRSLAALFDSLLDISRLDAGILQPQIKCVALAPILRKLAAEYLAEAFEEFYQIGNPERDRRNGVGLGLAIVKRIAALLAHRVNLGLPTGSGNALQHRRAVAPSPATKLGNRRRLLMTMRRFCSVRWSLLLTMRLIFLPRSRCC